MENELERIMQTYSVDVLTNALIAELRRRQGEMSNDLVLPVDALANRIQGALRVYDAERSKIYSNKHS